jgi:hypothetical protein
MMGLVAVKTMTVTYVLEVVVVLAVLYVSLPFLPETGLIAMAVPVKSLQVW